MKRLVLVILLLLCSDAQAATHWVSTTGVAAYGSCIGASPLSGAAACSLGTANSNAVAGDLVNIRVGTYDGGGSAIAIGSANNGTNAANMITFTAYNGEAVTITNYQNPFWFSGNSYISIKNITFSGTFSTWGRIDNGSHHIEIGFCTFASTTGGNTIHITGAQNQIYVTHNWIHDNHFQISGTGCTDGGSDSIDIGVAQGTFVGLTVDNDNFNTVENNFFEHAQHANWDNYGLFNVFRNNILHNEPWSTPPCSPTTFPPDYATGTTAWSSVTTYDIGNTVASGGTCYVSLTTANVNHTPPNASFWTDIKSCTAVPNYTSIRGNYSHRNFQITEDYNRNCTNDLVEGNRSGYAGLNQSNDGADDFSLAAPCNIVRYNFFYAAMNPGLLFKYARGSGLNSGGNGGTYNRVYNNTFFMNGYGNALGLTTGCNVGSPVCPFPESNISLYVNGSGEGNVLVNNIFYQGGGWFMYGSDVMNKGAPSSDWGHIGHPRNNWCSGTQTGGDIGLDGVHGCSASGNPLFTNPDLSNFSSKTLPDLSLQSSSTARDGGTFLTTATNSGASSTTLTVADANYFQDGTWGSDLSRPAAGLGGTMQADWIAIGTVGNTVQIATVTYGAYNAPAGTITLASPKTWSNGASIWLYKKSDGAIVLSGTAPDYGASEFTGSSAPILSFAPSPADFGSPPLITSSTQTVTVSNIGTASEVLSTPFFTLSGTNSGDWTVTGGTCANGGTIAVSSSCSVVLTFAPTALGGRTATLNIQGTVGGSDNLTGTGAPAIAPAIQMLTLMPLPAQPPVPTLTKISPASSYLTSTGFSQDGITFVPALVVTATGSGFASTTICTLDGTPITCTCGSPTSCAITIPSTLLPVPGSKTQHSIGVSNPAVTIPVLN